MAKLADALDLGSSALGVQVQILSPAPHNTEMTPKSWREGIILIPDLKLRSLFYMRLTFEDRLKMCEDHVLRGKSLTLSICND